MLAHLESQMMQQNRLMGGMTQYHGQMGIPMAPQQTESIAGSSSRLSTISASDSQSLVSQ